MKANSWTIPSVLMGFGLLIGWIFGQSSIQSSNPAGIQGLPIQQAENSKITSWVVQSESNGTKEQYLYVLDTELKVILIYRYNELSSKIKMVAARHFSTDLQLEEYNNESPHVGEIRNLLGN